MAERNTVGNNIRRLRIEADLTQEELALKSDLSQGYINQLENGKRRYTQKSLDLIRNALNVPLEELFSSGKTGISGEMRREARNRQKKRPSRKEFLSLLGTLPDQIVEHYFILLKLEKEIWKRRPQS